MDADAPAVPSGLWPYVRKYRRDIFLTLALAAPTVGLQLLLPWIVRHAVDSLAAAQLSPVLLVRLTVLYFGLSLLSAVLSREMRRFPLRAAHRVEFDIRQDLFTRLTLLEPAYFQRERIGDLMSRMTSDLTLVRDFVAQGILQGVRTTLVVLLSFSILFAANARLALVMLGLFPVTMGTFYLFLRRMRVRHDAVQSCQAAVSDFARETFSGIRTIKSFAMETRRRDAFGLLNAQLLRRNLSLNLAQQPLWPLFAFWFSLAMVLILWVGGAQVIRGRMTLGTLVLFIQYMLYMQWPLLAMSWVATLVQRGRVSWKRLLRILDAVPGIDDRAARPAPSVMTRPAIRFEGVAVRYGERDCLLDIDLEIPAGATIGITGPTGSGKTLLATLVPRLRDPDRGCLRIDGRDLRTIPLADLRRIIGFVSQEPMLFTGALAENIAFGLRTPDPGRIRAAARVAGLQDDIQGFSRGYDTLLGERGVTLSGGQRQRAALSRALARDPGILILDDALAAVDTQTEAAILDGLRPVLRQRTTLLISHRVSTLRSADRIVVIEAGRITQQGTHAELAARDGYYRRAHRLQRMSEVIGVPV